MTVSVLLIISESEYNLWRKHLDIFYDITLGYTIEEAYQLHWVPIPVKMAGSEKNHINKIDLLFQDDQGLIGKGRLPMAPETATHPKCSCFCSEKMGAPASEPRSYCKKQIKRHCICNKARLVFLLLKGTCKEHSIPCLIRDLKLSHLTNILIWEED